LRTITPRELNARFPKLVVGSFVPASRATPRYNCLGFAAKDERHWWQAERYGGRYYWPPNLPRITTVNTVTQIFAARGFQLTDNHGIEPGYEKVGIYASLDDHEFSHIAWSDGLVWKSKLGSGQDIDHYTLDVLEGEQLDEYGIVDRVLRKKL
jgi:hypothetical protein